MKDYVRKGITAGSENVVSWLMRMGRGVKSKVKAGGVMLMMGVGGVEGTGLGVDGYDGVDGCDGCDGLGCDG